jgi:hypothetical protein
MEIFYQQRLLQRLVLMADNKRLRKALLLTGRPLVGKSFQSSLGTSACIPLDQRKRSRCTWLNNLQCHEI